MRSYREGIPATSRGSGVRESLGRYTEGSHVSVCSDGQPELVDVRIERWAGDVTA
jgi:hypothetical protein